MATFRTTFSIISTRFGSNRAFCSPHSNPKALLTGGIIALRTRGIIALRTGGIIALRTEGIIALRTGGIIALRTGGIIALLTGGIIALRTEGIIAGGIPPPSLRHHAVIGCYGARDVAGGQGVGKNREEEEATCWWGWRNEAGEKVGGG